MNIEPDTYNIDANLIEAAITKKLKPSCEPLWSTFSMDTITAIANKYNLKVIIDGAQSFGSTLKEPIVI